MAGVTNAPFRTLCRRYGVGLYVSEMIGARALLAGDEKTLANAAFAPTEDIRSIQLYGTDPDSVGRAARLLVEEHGVGHIDLNFGCPVPKVTRHGGGAALPWKLDLYASIVESAVRGAGAGPATVKFRMGLDDDHLAFLDAGLVAEEAGVAAAALHARAAERRYAGRARCEATGVLREAGTALPGRGSAAIWTADGGRWRTSETRCDGTGGGRGCLGRPWLFGELAAALAGR